MTKRLEQHRARGPGAARRPIVRSVANSRVRCAIVIESELAITNAPTKSAMKPNESRNVLQEAREARCVARVGLACVAAAPHLRLRREDRAESEASSSASLTFAFLETRIWSSFPSLSNRRCAVARSKPASVAPPRLRPLDPNLTRPATLNGVAAPSASILIVSPTSMCFLPAVARSIDDLRSPSASSPRRASGELNSGLSRVDREAEVRRAAEADHLPVLADQVRGRRRLRRAPPGPSGSCLHLREQRLVERRQVVRARRR